MNKGTAIVGFILSFIAGMILIWGIDRSSGPQAKPDKDTAGTAAAPGETASGSRATPNPGAVKVDLFVMSQCPYGVQAEDAFKEVVEKLGPDLDLNIGFIGQTTPTGDLTTMHGAKELKGDLLQICAMKHAPGKAYDMILCQNKDWKNVDTNWSACAAQVGIAASDKIGACADGPEGKELLAASFKSAQEKGARGSPSIFINGQSYKGGRKGPDLVKAICNAHQGPNRPATCPPPSPKVNVTMLTDKRCAECNTQRLEGQITAKVSNPTMKTLDYGTPEGKALYDAIKPVNLPVAIFDKTLDGDADASQAFSRGARQAGDYKVFGGGSWNPACSDAGGCDLEECKSTLMCRPEEPNKLEVFVMSQCPFGVRGLDAMKEVMENFKKSNAAVDFKISFIGDGDAKSGLKAMHGQGEVDENIREICAINHYPKDYKYMDYIWCRNKNIKDANWQSCTGGDTGIDTEVIKTCFEGEEGKNLLEKSYAYSKSVGMSASPSWLANGKYKFSGVDPEGIKTNVCKYNKLGGCENKLSGPPPRPAGKGGQPAAEPGCGG